MAVSTSGNGSGTLSGASGGKSLPCGTTCGGNIPGGASVTLTATAAAGSYFAGWSGACSGTGASCSFTMDASKNVVATFKLAPLAVTPNLVITPTVSLTTKITFNQSDIGKQGAVFVTGWVPAGALKTLGIAGADADATQLVTRTSDDPSKISAAKLRVTQGTLAETDASAFVLVQLTASGWQMVVNGQLIPYASGVLGDALAAQSILNNADTSALTGAQFCVGYGTSAAEMLAGGRMVPVASIPDSGASAATGSCNVAASAPAAPYTGLFWNANESGWGMSVTQQGSTIFVAWYVYDGAGKPVWYVMSSCPLTGASCTGDIYSVTGGTPLAVPWNGAAKSVNKVGTGTLSFADANTATFNYSLNGVTAVKNLTRQVFASGATLPTVDYTALWWNANESGWGMALMQQYGLIFATIYTYDANGNAIWYVASNCPVVGNGCTGALYQVAGGKAPTTAWSGANIALTQVGGVSFLFTDSSIGTMNASINGATISKAIARQLF